MQQQKGSVCVCMCAWNRKQKTETSKITEIAA